jgi:translocation and assembly module TamB
MRRIPLFASLAAVALAFLALMLVASGGRAAEEDRGVLENFISRALSTPATRVSIGAVEGALSSDATIRDIQISDRDGVWLKLNRARIVWRRLALLQRRLEVDTLEVDTLEIVRRPIPAEAPVAGESEPLLPELPLRLEIKAFQLRQLVVGEPILGTAARITASGTASLGNPAEGLSLRFDARRLDAPGTLTARLALVPQGERLTLAVTLDEPEGGVLARAAQLPGLPPVKLELTGEGTLDRFAARLALDAGPTTGATGTATLNRTGTARVLGLDVQARVESFLPPVAAPIFAGTTRLAGTISFGDDRAITIPDLSLTATAARLQIVGGLDPNGVADLRVSATAVPNAPAGTSAGAAQIRRLAFESRIRGPVDAPSVEGTLGLEDLALPQGRVAKLDATFSAQSAAKLSNAATPIRLVADARATGVIAANSALAGAIGRELTLTLRGTTTPNGLADIETLVVRTPTIEARYAGRLGSAEVLGRLDVVAPDLSRFGAVAGRDLRGEGKVSADIEATPRARRVNLKLDAELARFASGIDAVDGVLGGQLSLRGLAALSPEGAFTFDKLRLAGAHVTAELDGSAGQDSADVKLEAALPDLKRADARLSGQGTLSARLTGSLQKPDVTARLAVVDATMLGRPFRDLRSLPVATDLLRAPEAKVTLEGEVDRKAARGSFRLARPALGATIVDALTLSSGSVAVSGNLAVEANGLAAGRLALEAGNLNDVSPLALTRLGGQLSAEAVLDVAGGGQNAVVKARGRQLTGFGATLDRVTADLRFLDVHRRPVISGTASIDEATIAGERIARIRLDATGTPQASDITLTASAREFDLDARARVIPGERTRIELTQFGATRAGRRLALAGPATLTIIDGGVDVQGVAVDFGAGRLTVSGTAGRRLDLRMAARSVPLSAAEIFAPGLGIAGTLNGEADLGGSLAAPTGDYRLRIDALALPQTRGAGLPRIDLEAAGRLDGRRATLDSTVKAGSVGTLRVTGSVPIGTGALDLAIRGTVDAGAASTNFLAAAGRRATGRVAIDASVGGTLANPQASGAATLSGGSYSDAALGVQLTNARARLVARGDALTIESAAASTRNGGAITASGRVRLDPGAGFPGDIRVRGTNAELVRNALGTAIANLDLALTGPLARAPRVVGRVDIVSADVAVPERLGAPSRPLPGTRHVRPDRTTRARLALENRGRDGRAEPPFDAALDLTVSAPGRIAVRGRGLDAELGGSVKLTGTIATPKAVGAFELRRGRLQVLTSRLDFTRGRLTFSGDLTPELDFLATANAGGASIQVAISGPASDPAFSFTSSPDLPQDEVLSRLLFGSPSGQLSAGQALALAQAAAQYSGDGGPDVFENLRRSLGLGGLDVNLGASGGPGVGLSRAIGDRVNVGVRTGATPAQTGIGVDVDITKNVRVKGEIGATGATSVGIGAEYEW